MSSFIEELGREGPFDLLLTDTSLFQSLTAAIQCDKGKKVLQIDENSCYGGPQAGSHKISVSNYSFIYDPSPIVFYARGPLSDLLLSLKLTDYLDFVAVGQQFIWPSQSVLIPLPLSKEQVMLERFLTLVEKRKLVKLLAVASNLNESTDDTSLANTSLADLLLKEGLTPESRVFQLIAYAACRCSSLSHIQRLSLKSAASILESLRSSVNHLSSYQSKSPFVIPIWGSSELSQAACRKAAVSGCIQIFQKNVTDCSQVIDSNQLVLRNDLNVSMSRMTLLINRPVLGITETCLITIPPSSDLIPNLDSSSTNILQLSSESKCCPNGTCNRIIHLWSLSQEIEKFDNIVKILISSETEIIWSKFESITTLPHYKTATDTDNTTTGTSASSATAAAPYQPLLPASFESELHFKNSLLAFNKDLFE